MSFLDDVIKRVKDYDANRPRSLQADVGWSEVGGCRAALGYRLDGAWPSDDPDKWGAIRGTAIHKLLEIVLADIPGYRTEVTTSYRDIPGHADLIVIDEAGVTDWKTTKLANSKLWQDDPATLWQKRVQGHGYAAGLVDAGELREDALVRLVIVPVDGTFEDWWAYEEPFDRELADWGADRLEDVRERLAEGAHLPKDKPYAWCQSWCEFFSLCRVQDDPMAMEEITDPEIAAAVAAYGEANKIHAAAGKEKERLAALIRGIRGVTPDGWRISLGKPGDDKDVLDEDAVRADYERRGFEPPMTTKPGNAPRLSVTAVKKRPTKGQLVAAQAAGSEAAS